MIQPFLQGFSLKPNIYIEHYLIKLFTQELSIENPKVFTGYSYCLRVFNSFTYTLQIFLFLTLIPLEMLKSIVVLICIYTDTILQNLQFFK